jgi:hypothetical protein
MSVIRLPKHTIVTLNCVTSTITDNESIEGLFHYLDEVPKDLRTPGNRQ